MPVVTGTEIYRPGGSLSPRLCDIGLFFPKVGAFSFGDGLTILGFMQEQVVHHLHWLTPQQFVDGLALGQLTPGSILMLAAGTVGALVLWRLSPLPLIAGGAAIGFVLRVRFP